MEQLVQDVLATAQSVETKRLPRDVVFYTDLPRKVPMNLPELATAVQAELSKHSSRFVLDCIRREPIAFDGELSLLFTLGSIGLLAPLFVALYIHHQRTKPTVLAFRLRVLRPAADPIPGTPDRNGVRARRYTV